MTDDLGGEAMTMIERDGGAHPWSMPHERSSTVNLTIPADVPIQHPIHLSRQQSGVQSIQRIVRTFAGPVAIRETKKVSLVDSIQHFDRRPLDNLICQRRDAERPLPPVLFGDEYSTHWLRSISPAPQPCREVC